MFDAMDVDERPPEYREDLCCPFPETCYNWTVHSVTPSLLLDCPAKGYAIFSMAAPQMRGHFSGLIAYKPLTC
jgi:hypothetical protein